MEINFEIWKDKSKDIQRVDSRYWLIPPEIYEKLDKEFHFTGDPCPYPFVKDGITEIEWPEMAWVNPPFRAKDAINGHGPTAFARKAIEESKKGKSSVLILPVQSYVNFLAEAGAEVRPIGRVKWIDARTGEPYKSPSTCALFVLRGKKPKVNLERAKERIKELIQTCIIFETLESIQQRERDNYFDLELDLREILGELGDTFLKQEK